MLSAAYLAARLYVCIKNETTSMYSLTNHELPSEKILCDQKRIKLAAPCNCLQRRLESLQIFEKCRDVYNLQNSQPIMYSQCTQSIINITARVCPKCLIFQRLARRSGTDCVRDEGSLETVHGVDHPLLP